MKRLAVPVFFLISTIVHADIDPLTDAAITRANAQAATSEHFFAIDKETFSLRLKVEGALRACNLGQLADQIAVTDDEVMPYLLERFAGLEPELQEGVCVSPVCAHDVLALGKINKVVRDAYVEGYQHAVGLLTPEGKADVCFTVARHARAALSGEGFD